MRTPETRTVAFATVGCKLNYAETATLARAFAEAGLAIVDFRDAADVVVINSCSVTEHADSDTRKLIRQARRRSPAAFVIVTGCSAQLRPDAIASIEGVDLVVGTAEKFRIHELAGAFERAGGARVLVGDPGGEAEFGAAHSADESARTRSFLKVQDGCDYACAFCTIPLARGGSRSLGADEVIATARGIIARGYREIVLSGVNVGTYSAGGAATLAELLERLAALPGGARFRISSIEPNLLSDEIIALAASSDSICPHFHIPLQAGSDQVLRLMRRRYTTALYRERVEHVLAAIPQAGIGVDVIAGHPGETEELFEEGLRFLTGLPFSYLHVFRYSERPRTHALTLPGSVPHTERARRSSLLHDLSTKKRRAFYESLIGSRQRVLFEGGDRDGRISGFTGNYARAALAQDPALAHTLRNVRITGIDGDLLRCDVLEPDRP